MPKNVIQKTWNAEAEWEQTVVLCLLGHQSFGPLYFTEFMNKLRTFALLSFTHWWTFTFAQ